MQKFKSVEELVNQLKPEKPVYCIRKNSIQSATKFFKNNFPGKILYAVKTNPHPVVIKQIIESGVDQFDVASIKEIGSGVPVAGIILESNPSTSFVLSYHLYGY